MAPERFWLHSGETGMLLREHRNFELIRSSMFGRVFVDARLCCGMSLEVHDHRRNEGGRLC